MPGNDGAAARLEQEVRRLRKINEVLMRRVEASMSFDDNAFSLFQHAASLEEKVEERTQALNRALRELETERAVLLVEKQRAEVANRAKDEFLATMSHEIRTPMNGVIGMTELLSRSGLEPRQQQLVDIAHRSAVNLLAVINDILDFSRLESGSVERQDTCFDLRQLVEEVLQMSSPLCRGRPLELIAVLPDELPAMVVGDAVHLRQIVVNLIGNAIKFTETGEVVIELAVGTEDGDRLSVRFSIADTGPGIAETDQRLVFEAFTQADASTRRRYEGSGLGLAISHRLVDLLGGELQLESRPGQGSRFFFAIPLTRSADADPGVVVPDGLRGTKMVVAYRNDRCREWLVTRLTDWGVECLPAASGRQALRFLREEDCDLVLFDMALPDLDLEGFLIRRREGRASPLPVVVAAPVDFDYDGTGVCDADVHFLSKPLLQRPLLECLASILSDEERPAARAESTRTDWHGLAVLLVEDNEVNQEVCRQMLYRLGCSVDVADDGFSAMTMFESRRYDLILMDCHLPRLDGFETTARIRRIEAEKGVPRVPIVALTADTSRNVVSACHEAGMDAYLSKPYTVAELESVLDRWGACAPADDGATHDPSVADVPASSGVAPDFDAHLHGLYRDDVARALPRIEAARRAGDLETLFQLAHRLKSSSLQLGETAAGEALRRLEAACREGLGPAEMERLCHVAESALAGVLERSAGTAARRESTGREEDPGTVVLLVDDDPVFRAVTSRSLEAAGCRVVEAASGAEALATVARHRPDLVLLDAMMPGMDGFEVCERFRRDGLLDRMPVIMLTGLDDDASIQRAFDAGAVGFEGKPVHPRILLARIRFTIRAKQNEQRLENERRELRVTHRMARVCSWTWRPSDGAVELSADFGDVIGGVFQHRRMSLDDFLARVDAEDRERLRLALESQAREHHDLQVEYRLCRDDGGSVVVRQDGIVYDGDEGGRERILYVVRDVTQDRRLEAEARRLAFHDSLTGLSNRAYLMTHLAEAIGRARRYGYRLSLLFLDLDDFKEVNDSLGHAVGDGYLRQVASRIQSCLRESDFAARLGGDEFCIVIENHGDEFPVSTIAEKVIEAVNRDLVIGERLFNPRCSLGIATFPDDASSLEDLLVSADHAMYMAKRSGKNGYYLFDERVASDERRRRDIEYELRRAIVDEEFFLCYQPQVRADDGRMVAVEALIRWRHPRRGIVSPVEFIENLERMGEIVQVGEWVVRQACRQIVDWRRRGLDDLRVAVNVSPRHFATGRLAEYIAAVLDETGVDPGRLELEITEGVSQANEAIVETMRRIQSLGVRIAIDDFGTGYSSLGSLHTLPVDCIKIDRIFIKDMLCRRESAAILGTIIGLARSTGCETVAEGVESIEQALTLHGLGCDLLQGFCFSRPVSSDEIVDLAAKGSFYDGREGAEAV